MTISCSNGDKNEKYYHYCHSLSMCLLGQLPTLTEASSRRYLVSITSHKGTNVYLPRRQLFFNRNDLGFVLLKTDKPIYKPSQTGTYTCI